MNEHIELAKKWLADNDSVSLEELKANKKAAYRAADEAARAAHAVWAAHRAANYADMADYWAFRGAEADNYVENAECYKKLAIEAVKEYEELTK